MKITIPELSLVVLIGPSGTGKSTFAHRHFRPSEVLSSDLCRALVSDDENDQSATPDAFDVLHYIAAKRLAAGKLTVVDATNVQPEARKPLIALARQHHLFPVAIVLDLPQRLCHERNRERSDRDFGPGVVQRQSQQLRRSLRGLQREGFRYVYRLSNPEEVEAAVIERQPLWSNLQYEHGPFDIIGDIHGCVAELNALLSSLGYEVNMPSAPDRVDYGARHPEGRKVVFLGDLVDRGPDTLAVVRLAMSMVRSGDALCVPGNHDVKLSRKLRGRDVQIAHGLAESLAQFAGESDEFCQEVASFIEGLVSHYVLDDGKLVVAHAGMKQEMQGRSSSKVRDFALYGETTGETDEFGLPVRYNWSTEYRGKATVVYGHTPVPKPEWVNRTINIDTGCVFGGSLTALRYPEMELVSVPSERTYAQPAKPLSGAAEADATARLDTDLPDVQDVLGRHIVGTKLLGNVTIQEENAATALEVMSRFAVSPRWLIYLPPTMSPSETSRLPDILEHPSDAFAYYRREGIPSVICEEKHMGSRAVVIVCRDEQTARERFDAEGGESGVCYTRTGRRFFESADVEAEFMSRLRNALGASGFWEEFRTEWVCLDCELMPWSAKAQELLRDQYAAVGSASQLGLSSTIDVLGQAAKRGVDVEHLLERSRERMEMSTLYVEAYGRYCWSVRSIEDLKLAPFHVLATEGRVHTDKDHEWHMRAIEAVCRQDPGLLLGTRYMVIDLADPVSQERAIAWWEDLTRDGGEGIVIKPLSFTARGHRGIVQPALKSRGREYLRIIYGPEYTAPENLPRLRTRSLARKRSLALREFALGVEALEMFVRREPLYRIHECVFGVLALESEPVDPRL